MAVNMLHIHPFSSKLGTCMLWLDALRSEVMKQLCIILEGNVRIRFDLDMEDLMQASVYL